MEGVAHFVAKKAIGAPDARAEWWGQCVTEFGEMDKSRSQNKSNVIFFN